MMKRTLTLELEIEPTTEVPELQHIVGRMLQIYGHQVGALANDPGAPKLEALAVSTPFGVIRTARRWHPIHEAPRDETTIYAYGRFARGDQRPVGVPRGDHWWALLRWDRAAISWVYAKDGRPAWSTPIAYQLVEIPEEL